MIKIQCRNNNKTTNNEFYDIMQYVSLENLFKNQQFIQNITSDIHSICVS